MSTSSRDSGTGRDERQQGVSIAGHAAPGRVRAWRAARGFTLIEVLIVMVLIVILAGIGLVVYGNSVTRAKEAALKENLFRMRDAIDQYYADKNRYPADLEALVADRYLRAIPVDPFTNSADTWETTLSDLDAGNPASEPGIYDVKSGSEQVSIDGSPYRDW